MVKEGMILNINGQEGIICGLAESDGNKYVNVAFETENNTIFKIYSYRFENDEVIFSLEKDKAILEGLVHKFVLEGVNDNGFK